MVMDFLRNNSQGLTQAGIGLLSGRTPQEQFAMGAQGFMQGQQANQTANFIKNNYPELWPQVQAGVLTPREAYDRYVASRTKKAPLQINGKLVDPDTYQVLADFSDKKPENPNGELGLNLVYGVDANNNPVVFQPSKGGGLVQAQVPQGVTLMDPYNRAYNTATGKASGEATSNLPTVEGAANVMLSTIESLEKDPYLDSMVGSVQGRLPNFSSDAARVQSKMDQIQGQTFLQAYNSLRGGGQITEVEGAKAEAAMARLNTAQNEADYRAALSELKQVIQSATERARAQAQGVRPMGGAMPRGNRTSSGVQWSVEP